ncbi:hypothetical protein BGX26_004228 [Mortierella sp. AD094]|nr:hypothetical protein BGX26_004228 [Mortierella sp. AD094]
MSESHIQEHETQEPIIVPEGATITPEPALIESEQEQTLVKTTEDATITAAVVVAKPSRLSAAFKAVSCGLCIHPWKNSNPTDYHTLVVTPTDEDAPLLDEDHHDVDHGASGKAITEDFKELHISDVGASSSTEYHRSSLDVETKVVEQEQVTSTFMEEITIVEGSAQQTSEVTEIREVQQQPEEVQTIVAAVIEARPAASPSSPTSPSRTSSPFAKLVKRSSSANNVPSPTSSTNSSPLLGRLGRFAKIIRTSETSTSTSVQSKVESLKVASVPESTEEGAKQISAHLVESSDVAVVDLGDLAVAKQDYQVEIQETVMVDDHHETDILSEEPSELEVESLAVNTSVATSKPVAIPGQSPETPTSWAQSPTLHQNDVSINGSLAKVGRTSTVGSANGSETGSLGSSEIQNSPSAGKDSGIAELSKKRKNSVLKKIGKAIKNSKDKVDRRLSRQGSLALDSPIEAEENNVH